MWVLYKYGLGARDPRLCHQQPACVSVCRPVCFLHAASVPVCMHAHARLCLVLGPSVPECLPVSNCLQLLSPGLSKGCHSHFWLASAPCGPPSTLALEHGPHVHPGKNFCYRKISVSLVSVVNSSRPQTRQVVKTRDQFDSQLIQPQGAPSGNGRLVGRVPGSSEVPVARDGSAGIHTVVWSLSSYRPTRIQPHEPDFHII